MRKKILLITSVLMSALMGKAQVFTDNYSTNTGWTQVGTGISVTGGTATYTTCADAANRRIHKNHGIALNYYWRLDFEFRFSGTGNGGPGHHLASLTAGTLDPVYEFTSPQWNPTNQDAVAVMFYSTNQSQTASTFQLVGTSKNDNGTWVNSAGIVLAQNTMHYISLERLDQTHGRVSVFTDAARTIHATNSPQCFAIDPGVSNNLPILQHGNTSWGSSARSLTGTIDNTTLTRNNYQSEISGNQTICSGTGDPVAFTNVSLPTIPGATYQWQSSTNGGANWNNIAGATSSTYDAPSGITLNTMYRRVTTYACNAQIISNSITITVQDCNLVPCGASDNFSTSAGWTTVGTGLNISSNVFNFTSTCTGGSPNRLYKQHGLTLTNRWRLDFDFNFSEVGDGGPGHHIASVTSGNQDPVSNSSSSPYTATNQDAIAAMFYSTNHTNTPSTFKIVGCSKNDNNAWALSGEILLTQNTNYYITLERLDQTHGRICVYSDAARMNHIAGSPQCFTIDQNVAANLPYIQHGNTSWAGYDRWMTATLDNDCLSNTSFSGGTVSMDQKVPCGQSPSSLMNTTLATGPTNSYSFTYQWQSSPNGINWTNIAGATFTSYQPLPLSTTTYFRRVAFGPCGMELYSNTITITVTMNPAMDAEFSLSTNCQTGNANFTVLGTANINSSSGSNFLGTWSVEDLTVGGAPVSLSTWNNVSPCNFTGYTFIQGHTYKITRTVKDDCTNLGSAYHTVICQAGIIIADQDQQINHQRSMNASVISAYPNPATSVVTVDLNGIEASKVFVYNMQGKLVQTLNVSAEDSEVNFDMTAFPKGIYLINVHANDQLYTQKIIKE